MFSSNSYILTTVVSVISSVCTYFVTRQKKRNDFIADLQNSIDLLSKHYTETLNELIQVKETNLKLSLEVQQLITENKKLRNEINSLSSRVSSNA